MRSQPRLRLSGREKDIVIDDSRTSLGHGRDTGHPGSRDLAESFSDRHLTVLAERDARVLVSLSEDGNTSRRSSMLRLIHGVGRIALRQRAMVVLPELEEPLRTIT